jgi:CheY-like chemotaxis protein
MAPAGSETHRMAGEIEKAAECAVSLTRQMLAYAGGGQSAVEPMALDDLVRDMTMLLETAAHKNARLRLSLEPAVMRGDASQIRQIVMNLITNASDAISQSGEIHIGTGVRTVSRAELQSPFLHDDLPAGDYAWIQVRDSGSGMTADTLARIFDPFFSTKVAGRGLGLAAVLGIVRGHGGTIKVASAPGEGSRFEVLLPHYAGSREDRTAVVDEPPVSARAGTILVVEDDPGVRQFVARAVQEAGFDVALAVDGRHGLDEYARLRDRIRAVLIDYVMPGLNGDEVAAEIRRHDPVLPIVVTSGYSEVDVRSRATGNPEVDFIQKPFRAGDLVQKLSTAMVLRASREPAAPGAEGRPERSGNKEPHGD